MKTVIRRLTKLEHQLGYSGKPRERFRMVIRRADSAPTLEGATCKRSLCPDGSLFEFVKFLEPSDGSHELSQEEIDRWVETFPIE